MTLVSNFHPAPGIARTLKPFIEVDLVLFRYVGDN
jgi:hypothetical protein